MTKKPYESLLVERKNRNILECRLKHCFRNNYLEVLRNNVPRLIKKFLRKHHAEKGNFFSNLRRAAISTNCFLLVLK